MKSKESWLSLKVENNQLYKAFEKRRNEIIAMHKNGNTPAQIGQAFGITRQRVYQILKGGE